MNTELFLEKPVGKLFFHYLIPSICGTMVTSIYVLADTIIIGKGIGLNALAALNIILPLFNVFFGAGLLYGVGGSVLMSISRGQQKEEQGNRYFTLALCLNILTCLLFMVFFLNFKEEVMRFLGATEETMPYIMQYVPYIFWGLWAFSFSSFLQTFVRNDGAPKLAMTAVVAGGIFNVVFDLIFVFPLHMGMGGAAFASVCGSALTVLILTTHFFSKSNRLFLVWRGLSIRQVGRIYKNGFTSFLVEICSGILMFVFNLQILRYIGNIGVSMYGVISNVAIVVLCLCNGINQAAQPILSVNFGAGRKDRIEKLKKLGILTSLVICSIPAVIGLISPNLFPYIFLDPPEELLRISVSAIRIYFTAFFVTGINMFLIGYFQSTLKAHFSLILCLLRGCLLGIILVYLLPPVLGVEGIWLSVPLAEFFTVILGFCFVKMTKNNKFEE